MDNYEYIDLNKWDYPYTLKPKNFMDLMIKVNDDNIFTNKMNNTLYSNGKIIQLSPLDTELLKINTQRGGMIGGVDDEIKLNEDELLLESALENKLVDNSLLLLPLNPLKIIYLYFKKYLPDDYWDQPIQFKSNPEYMYNFRFIIRSVIEDLNFVKLEDIKNNKVQLKLLRTELKKLIRYYNDEDMDLIIENFFEKTKGKIKINDNDVLYCVQQAIDNTDVKEKQDDAMEEAIVEYINEENLVPNIDPVDVYKKFKAYISIKGDGQKQNQKDFLEAKNDPIIDYLNIKDKIPTLKKIATASIKLINGVDYLMASNKPVSDEDLDKIICDPVEVIADMIKERATTTTAPFETQTRIRYFTDFYNQFPYCCNNGCFRLVGTEIFKTRNVFKNFRQACKKCDDARVANDSTNHIYDHGYRVHIFNKKIFFVKTMPTILKRDYCENAIPERRMITIRTSFLKNPAMPPTVEEEEKITEFNKKLQIRRRIGDKSKDEYEELQGIKQQCPLNLIGDKWDAESIKKEFGVINYEKKKYLIGLSKIYNYLVSNCYDQDHISGEHTSNVFNNLWTLCKICHGQKTLLGGDFGVKKDSDKFESGSTKIVNDVFVKDKDNAFIVWDADMTRWQEEHNKLCKIYYDELKNIRIAQNKIISAQSTTVSKKGSTTVSKKGSKKGSIKASKPKPKPKATQASKKAAAKAAADKAAADKAAAAVKAAKDAEAVEILNKAANGPFLKKLKKNNYDLWSKIRGGENILIEKVKLDDGTITYTVQEWEEGYDKDELEIIDKLKEYFK